MRVLFLFCLIFGFSQIVLAAGGAVWKDQKELSSDDDSKKAIPATSEVINHYELGQKAIQRGEYEKAIEYFKIEVDKQPRNTDAHNYMGFAFRKLGKLRLASSSYYKVFAVDPNHKGALEYQGELYLRLGKLGLAQENLAKLKILCPSGCKEYTELTRAIMDFHATKN